MNTQKIYEIGMLINPDLSQQEAEKVVEKVKDILTKKSASVISEGEIVKIDLAYQIITKIASKNERFDEANFTWVKFEAETSVIDEIKKEIDKIKKEVFRYLIVKTVASDDETNKFKLIGDEEGDEIEEIEEEVEIEVEEIEEGDTTDNNEKIEKEEEEKKEEKEEEVVEDEEKKEGFLSKLLKK